MKSIEIMTRLQNKLLCRPRRVLGAHGALGAVLAAAAAMMVVLASAAAAETTSDHPAAILVFPKILVDTESPDGRLDTFITISNVSSQPLNVLCFYVNSTPRCDNGTGACFPERTCTGNCLPQWQQTDFRFRLTREQPTGWMASVGAGVGCQRLGLCTNDGVTTCEDNQDCPPDARCAFDPCFPLDGDTPGGNPGQTNQGSLVPPSPEDPFIGELKCIAVDETGAPTDRNDLIGHVTIGYIGREGTFIDVAGYNPVGIPAIAGANNRNLTLVVGGPTGANPGSNPADAECLANQPSTCAEYEGCPNVLILDHYYDGAVDPQALNRCLPGGVCAVSGGACTNDSDCIDNTCDLGSNTCTVSGDACAVDADCENTCDAITQRCTLSGENCGPFGSNGYCSPTTLDVRVVTEITMVPCSQDFEEGIDFEQLENSQTQVQFLVFNEFEQRLSTSTTVTCFKETPLWRLDANDSDPERSIFSVGVGGTLTGQTRMRGVVADGQGSKPRGNALIAIAEEFRCSGPIWEFPRCSFVNTGNLVSSVARNVHFQGRRPQSDFIYLPLQ